MLRPLAVCILAAATLLTSAGCARQIGEHYVREYAGPHGVSVRTGNGREAIDAPYTHVRVNHRDEPTQVHVRTATPERHDDAPAPDEAIP